MKAANCQQSLAFTMCAGARCLLYKKNHLSVIIRLFKPNYNGKVILMVNMAKLVPPEIIYLKTLVDLG